MPSDSEYKTPGQLIEALLDEKGWSRKVAAIVLDVDEPAISRLVTGKRAVDADWAVMLGELFGVAAERFLDLQRAYDLARARLVARPDPGRAKRAHLFGGLPIADMIKRGWISADDVRDVAKVELELTRFFNAPTVDEIEILPHAAKRTNVVGDVTPIQLAWLYRVKEIANDTLVPRYTPEGATKAVAELRRLLSAAEEARKVPRILAEAGIRFLMVESLPSAKIDGVCFWLNDSAPVIALSLRHDRVDNFWFVLRHELEHVIRRHGMSAMMLDVELEGERAGTGSTISEEERVANEAAAEFCVPRKAMDSFIARKQPFFAERDFIGFSRANQIHPGIVAGQLQHRTGRFDRFRQHQVKVRSIVAPGAYVDGWGDVYPID